MYKACGAVNGTLIRVNSTATTDGVAAYNDQAGGGGGGSGDISGRDGGDGDTRDAAILSLVRGARAGSEASFCGPGSNHGSAANPNTTTHSVQLLKIAVSEPPSRAPRTRRGGGDRCDSDHPRHREREADAFGRRGGASSAGTGAEETAAAFATAPG